jgi:hypothetical protein
VLKIMSPTAIPSIRSRGALYLVLLGGAGFAVGLYLVVTGIPAAIAGQWFGANGSVASVVFGAWLCATGIWLARRGRRVQRALRNDNTVVQ